MSRTSIKKKKEYQTIEKESFDENNDIREALLEGEKSGFGDKSIDDIWNEAKNNVQNYRNS